MVPLLRERNISEKGACLMRSQRGATLIEFAFALIIFSAFLYGLICVSMWGMGGQFVQNAIHESARKYAVTGDQDEAKIVAVDYLNRWGYLFVEPIDVHHVYLETRDGGKKVYGAIVAKPRIKQLYVYELPELRRESSCAQEHYLRYPELYESH